MGGLDDDRDAPRCRRRRARRRGAPSSGRPATAPAPARSRPAHPLPPPSAARDPPPPAPPAAACRALCQSLSGSSASQRSTPGVSDSTLQSSRRTTSPGASGPSGSVASPTSSPRRAPSARYGATSRRKRSSSAVEQGLVRLAIEPQHAPGVARPRAQGDEHFLLRSVRAHVEVASRGCGWGRLRSPRGASRSPARTGRRRPSCGHRRRSTRAPATPRGSSSSSVW